jgi:phosphoribosylaminoimidazolecarboxamide formyltransferase/IMP cyclohydrolase
MVVVNLYPFAATVAHANVTPERARTNIDIGGPCMIRASAKNFLRVASVTQPEDYAGILDELQARSGALALDTRLELARKAFAHTAEYDRSIADYFARSPVAEVEACYTVERA